MQLAYDRPDVRAGDSLPHVIDVPGERALLAAWLRQRRPQLESLLRLHGALLFRNAHIETGADFEAVAQALADDLYTQNGEHVPHNDSGTVQTPVFYPPENKILWHSENSFHYRWPGKVLFSCILPAAQGGETPIVDTRLVYRRLSGRTRELFESRKVMYVRNYVYGFGLPYQKTLNVSGPAEAEAWCRENRVQFDWRADVLRTRAVRSAVIRHPHTEAKCFVAQCLHWHQLALPEDVREGLRELYGEELMPRDLRWGDGSAIEDSIVQELRGVYEELEVARPWGRGEVLLLDNLLVSHARNPYLGERKLLVALAEPYQYSPADAEAP
jgi:alpha-ketoglutarate-dependent taurine dioxygenase